MVNFTISSVEITLNLQRRCPYCGRNNGNIHSSIKRRRIADIRIDFVAQRRMKCPWCKTTWTLRKDAVGDGRHRTDRLILIGATLHKLGLSERRVEQSLPLLGCEGSKSGIERDVQSAGHKARQFHRSPPRMRVNVPGVDTTDVKMAGKPRAGLLFFVDVDRGN